MKKLIFLTLLLMFSVGYAREVCETVEVYKGCPLNKPDLWNCDGDMVTRICDPDEATCTGSCKQWGDISVSNTDCSNEELYVTSTSSVTKKFFSFTGFYQSNTLIDLVKSTCPYDLLLDLTHQPQCTEPFLIFWCNAWRTTGSYVCQDVLCAENFIYENKNCERDFTTQTNCYNEEEGSCTKKGFFCQDNGVTQCTETGGYYTINDCDKEDRKCRDVAGNKAICEDQDNKAELLNCTPSNSKRCNPSDLLWVQNCENTQWVNSFKCLMGCNNTGVSDPATQCVTTNVEVGGCTNGNTFCHDTGNKAYYFLCVNTNFQLLYQCDTPRCDLNATTCYDGCSLFESKYYTENNTGYYCNEEGDWILQGECAGIVNEFTNQCELPEKCTSGTITCSQNWVTECVNEEWRYIKQCSLGCAKGKCKIEGASLFEKLSYAGDFLVVILPTISMFMAMILAASTIGYLLRNVFRRAFLWVQGKVD